MIRDSCLALLMLSSGTCREGTFSQDDEDEDWDDRDEDEEDEEMGEAHMSQPLHTSVGMPHPLGCWVMHQRWGVITCEVRRILPWCYPKKLWCSICFKSSTSFYHPTYPSLSLTSEVGKLSDLHISPRIHMYQNTQTYIRTLFCHIRDSIYRDNIEWIM